MLHGLRYIDIRADQCTAALDCSVINTLNGIRVQVAAGTFDVSNECWCQSEWTLDRHCSVDIITTLTLRGTMSTVGLSACIV